MSLNVKSMLCAIFMALMSFSLVAGEAKQPTKIAIKTKQGKSVITKNGHPVYIKARTKK